MSVTTPLTLNRQPVDRRSKTQLKKLPLNDYHSAQLMKGKLVNLRQGARDNISITLPKIREMKTKRDLFADLKDIK